ncbi:MAG: hypothetical protein HY600_02505 [Candidatus Omnitrophica bacterium]|nr:hypothetical protein [Candidatus Omnitrophota bacterium]
MVKRQSSERTRTEVLLENIQSQVQTIAEGHGVLDRKLDQFRQDVEERFTTLEAAMKIGFRDLCHRLDTHVHA